MFCYVCVDFFNIYSYAGEYEFYSCFFFPFQKEMSEFVDGFPSAVVNRKRTKKFFFLLGGFYATVSIIIVFLESPIGYVFSLLGIVYITIGVYKWKKENLALKTDSKK